MTAYEERIVIMGPGAHIVEFVYRFDPQDAPSLTGMPDWVESDYAGTVHIDDVYFVPSLSELPVLPDGVSAVMPPPGT
jgi:hypothetical protein